MGHASADDLIIQDLHRHWQLRSMDLDDLQQLFNLRFCLPDVPLRKVAAAGAAPQKVGGVFSADVGLRSPLLRYLFSRKFGASLGKSRGGNALSLLEVKEPRGSLCVFGNFLHIRKLPRCGARSSTKERFAET